MNLYMVEKEYSSYLVEDSKYGLLRCEEHRPSPFERIFERNTSAEEVWVFGTLKLYIWHWFCKVCWLKWLPLVLHAVSIVAPSGLEGPVESITSHDSHCNINTGHVIDRLAALGQQSPWLPGNASAHDALRREYCRRMGLSFDCES